MEAIKAVFRSWDNPRANVLPPHERHPLLLGHRRQRPDRWCSATWATTSGTGVAFTRDPATGEKKLFGEYLINAQGEDVVAGIRTPQTIEPARRRSCPRFTSSSRTSRSTLENHYRDMQDMEFTIEHGKLYMLQTRNGKRTAAAALKIAVDLVDEGMITERRGRPARWSRSSLTPCCTRSLTPTALKAAKADRPWVWPPLRALPAARSYFTAEDAKNAAAKTGQKVVLVRLETSPEDIEGMAPAQGILTVRGGMTSHAAVVARGMGTCCVAGCGELHMDEEDKTFDHRRQRPSTRATGCRIDGSTGKVYGEAIPTVDATISGDFGRLHGLGGRGAQAERPHQRRQPA